MPERLVLQSTGERVGEPVRYARTLLERTRGLLGSDAADAGALIIERARQVHTFGMRYPLDVIFCDAHRTVVHVVRDMKPRRITRWVRRARIVVEVPSNARHADVAPGDVLVVETF